jgi:pimeloyl-ACP methyl ester carboxylesterase
VSHASLGDLELHYDLHGPAEGPPLLLLHGFFGAASDWTPFLDRFGTRPVVAVDLRGHGRSTNPDRTFTHRDAATDVLALMDHLGVERFDALGLSGGGNTLLHVATRAPARVGAMVLVSATTHFPEPARALQRGFELEQLPAAEQQRLRERHVHGEAQIAMLLAQARAFADSHDDLAFTPAQLATIRARTLIVYGDRDPFYPVEIAVAMYRAIPRAALWVVPEAGHTPVDAELLARAGRWLTAG